jgi:hypothetical protein
MLYAWRGSAIAVAPSTVRLTYLGWRACVALCLGFCGAGNMAGCNGHSAGRIADAGNNAPENCTDGVDNDGNGLVDCEDPACQAGYTCVTVPADWTIGAFLPNLPEQTQPSCPPGYAPKPLLVQEPASTVTCSCTCGTSCGEIFCDPSTVSSPPGPVILTTDGPDGGCSEGDAGTVTSSACVPYHLTAGQSIGFAHPPIWGSSILSIGNITVGHPNAVLCTASATGGGCGAGRACVQKPSSGDWGICPYQSSKVDGKPLSAPLACPEVWLNSVNNDGGTPVAVTVATSWDVSGSCTPCECDTDPEAGCADATLKLYSDPNCQSSVATVDPGVCAVVSADIQSAQYAATPVHAGCTNSPSVQTGIETSSPNAGYVVCCAH